MSQWTMGLNPEQERAVQHNFGPLLILAGAGSGKTTVLVSRTGRLIDEGIAQPKQICVLTFTNKAARELKHRVSRRLGSSADGVWAGTFHSFGLQILKQFYKEARLPKGFGILDSSDTQGLMKEILKDFTLADKADFDAGKLSFILSDLRSKNKKEAEGEDVYSVAASWLLPRYLKRIHQLGVVDFDELLLRPLKVFRDHPEVKARVQCAFTQVMVDEFQDTNRTQMQLVTEISETHNNITVVGDDDQSIYGWRGACIDNILGFPHHFEKCDVVRLESNYRSSQSILNVANKIIEKNEKRHQKILRASPNSLKGNLPEVFVYETEDEEVERIIDDIESQIQKGKSADQFAILFRSNTQGAVFEAELKKRGVAHKVSGTTSFFERKEIKDVLAYLRCGLRPHEVAFRRIVNTPNRGIGDVSIECLETFAQGQKISLFQAASRWREAGVQESAGLSLDHLLNQLRSIRTRLLDSSTQGTACLRLMSLLADLGYKQHLEKYSKDAQQFHMRWRLIETFGNVLDKFISKGGLSEKTLKEFVEAMELRDEGQDDDDDKKPAIQLLTLHACKGLEFPNVYLVGLEEDILPHKTLGSDVSEERRLFYVGVTRAQEHLIMSRCKVRRRYGSMAQAAPSRFLLELPKDLYVEHGLGHRPVSQDERKSMLADFYKKFEAPSKI